MANTLQLKYFVSVDELLVFNWLRCLADDLTFLRRNLLDGTPEDDAAAWREFREDHLKRIGQTTEQDRFNRLKDKHTNCMLKWVAEPMDSPMKPVLFMDMEQAQDALDYFLKAYADNNENFDSMKVEKTMAKLSNKFSRSISTRNTTVMELHVLTQLEN